MKALGRMQNLGTGCQIVKNEYISTVPFELNDDNVKLVELAQKRGYISCPMILKDYSWSKDRIELAIVYIFSI